MPKKPALGFTLIEILVTISLIGILSSVGIASYMEFSRRQLVLQTARKVIQDLRLAQSLSASNQKPIGCNSFSGYSFIFSGNSYTVTANCLSPVIYKTDSLPTGFTHTGFTQIFFKLLNQGTICTPTANPCQLVITGNNLSKTVSVGSGGVIKIEGE